MKTADPFDPANWDIPFQPKLPDFSKERWIEPTITTVRDATGRPIGCFTCGGSSGPAPTGPLRLFDAGGWERLGSVEVWTLRYGDAWYVKELGSTLDRWCARHGHTLRVHDGSGYSVRQFSKVDMIRQFLEGDADWFFYVDSDCYLHEDAPDIFETVNAPGLWSLVDLESTAKQWPGWLQEPVPEDYRYRNTGVFAMDRDTATKLLPHLEGEMRKGYLEQNQFNLWFAKSGVVMRDLPDKWNSFRNRTAPAWLFHLAGHRKDERLLKLRSQGRVPDPVKRLKVRVPDFGKGAVVWPWKSSGLEWDELRYSMLSVRKHWSERDWPLVLLGDSRPDWWTGEFIKAVSYEEAVELGVACADRVLWMNDDILMLGDQSPETFATARVWGGNSGDPDMTTRLGSTLVAANTWRRGLGQVLVRGHHHGRTCLNFSSHTPYLFERDKAREVLETFGSFHKIPFETAYHNWHRTPWTTCDEKARGPHHVEGKLWINPSMGQVTPEFRRELVRRFGE